MENADRWSSTYGGIFDVSDGSKDDRFRKSQPRFLRGTGGIHGINCSLDESQFYYTRSDRNSVCNCYDHYSGSSNEEKTEMKMSEHQSE